MAAQAKARDASIANAKASKQASFDQANAGVSQGLRQMNKMTGRYGGLSGANIGNIADIIRSGNDIKANAIPEYYSNLYNAYSNYSNGLTNTLGTLTSLGSNPESLATTIKNLKYA